MPTSPPRCETALPDVLAWGRVPLVAHGWWARRQEARRLRDWLRHRNLTPPRWAVGDLVRSGWDVSTVERVLAGTVEQLAGERMHRLRSQGLPGAFQAERVEVLAFETAFRLLRRLSRLPAPTAAAWMVAVATKHRNTGEPVPDRIEYLGLVQDAAREARNWSPVGPLGPVAWLAGLSVQEARGQQSAGRLDLDDLTVLLVLRGALPVD